MCNLRLINSDIRIARREKDREKDCVVDCVNGVNISRSELQTGRTTSD